MFGIFCDAKIPNILFIEFTFKQFQTPVGQPEKLLLD